MTDEPAWGEGPSSAPAPSRPSADRPSAERPSSDRPSFSDRPPRAPGLLDDPAAAVAVGLGVVGLLIGGILLAVVVAVLAAEAARRARDSGRTQRYALWGFGLAVLDATVWLVLHLAFDLRFLAG